VGNVWTSSDNTAGYQRYGVASNTAAATAYSMYNSSNATIVDASFIRVKNVAISYSLPSSWLKGIQTRLYFQVQNAFTITNFQGLDPENSTGSTLPPLKTFVFGADISL
jgi:hypothetical protein